MSVMTSILVYVIIWWLIFFMMLPVGVKSQDESDEEVVPGSPSSAPAKPDLWRKALTTTLIAAVLFAVFYLVVEYDVVSLRS